MKRPWAVFCYELLPEGFGFVNATMDKKQIGAVIADCYKRFGQHTTVNLLDSLKEFGFNMATKAGISI
ncbi:MAG TPA: hypothetical protein PK470_08975, partial [Candidatus Omnitrophota bacterium]|nr:hypothetical protein [Candidatus Omnitrophota bacterium]